MSDWTVHLEFEEGTSSKFWRARIEGQTLYVNYGKIGTNGQTQVKELASPAAAKKEYDKLVAEKRKKGYVDAGAGGGKSGADEDADDDAEEGDEEADDAPTPAPKKTAVPAAKPSRGPGERLVLEAGNRRVETTLFLDGATVRMDSAETYASPEAAKKAYERLKKTLAGEGYTPGS